MRVRDTSGTYYWHIPTGTTQWEPPSPLGKVGSSMMSSSMSLETTPCEEPEVRFATPGLARTEAEVTELTLAYPLRSTLQESWAQLSGTDEGTSEGELWRVSVGQSDWVSSGWRGAQCVNVSGWCTCLTSACCKTCTDASSHSFFHVFRRRLRLHLIRAWRSLKGQLFVMPPSTWSTIWMVYLFIYSDILLFSQYDKNTQNNHVLN